jgi:hypothetical protein
MDYWQALRYAHIAAGVLGFLVAPVALATAKGSKTHKRWGWVYFYAMTFATLAATVLAATTNNTFFTFVGLFSFYLGFSGVRAVGIHRHGVRWYDWAITVAMTGVMLAMLAMGIYRVVEGNNNFIPIVVFGLLGSFVVLKDLKRLIRPSTNRKIWFFTHMTGMVASAIAAMSAFSVTNMKFIAPVPRILWPTAVGLPLLLLWVQHYKRKMKVNRANASSEAIDKALPG